MVGSGHAISEGMVDRQIMGDVGPEGMIPEQGTPPESILFLLEGPQLVTEFRAEKGQVEEEFL